MVNKYYKILLYLISLPSISRSRRDGPKRRKGGTKVGLFYLA